MDDSSQQLGLSGLDAMPDTAATFEGRSDHPHDSVVLTRERAWYGYLDLIDDLKRRRCEFNAAYGSNGFTFPALNDDEVREQIEAHAKEAITRLVTEASGAFGFAGRDQSIPLGDIFERFWPEARERRQWRDRVKSSDPRKLSLVDVWRYLKANHRGAGRDQALRTAAEDIIRQLPFRHYERSKGRIRTEGAFTVFKVYLSASKKSYGCGEGAYQLTYHHKGFPELDAFGVFLAWSEDSEEMPADYGRDLSAFRGWIQSNDGCFDSRTRRQIGPIGLQFFKSDLEYRFPQALAQRLNLFLTQFANQQLAEALAER